MSTGKTLSLHFYPEVLQEEGCGPDSSGIAGDDGAAGQPVAGIQFTFILIPWGQQLLSALNQEPALPADTSLPASPGKGYPSFFKAFVYG